MEQPFQFMDLPRELRLEIYERLEKKVTHVHIVCEPDACYGPIPGNSLGTRGLTVVKRTTNTAIMAVSKVINAEARVYVQRILKNFILAKSPKFADERAFRSNIVREVVTKLISLEWHVMRGRVDQHSNITASDSILAALIPFMRLNQMVIESVKWEMTHMPWDDELTIYTDHERELFAENRRQTLNAITTFIIVSARQLLYQDVQFRLGMRPTVPFCTFLRKVKVWTCREARHEDENLDSEYSVEMLWNRWPPHPWWIRTKFAGFKQLIETDSSRLPHPIGVKTPKPPSWPYQLNGTGFTEEEWDQEWLPNDVWVMSVPRLSLATPPANAAIGEKKRKNGKLRRVLRSIRQYWVLDRMQSLGK
ncbi:hypothetical protein B0J11DRAFT_502907 [Dendryphion nanum]|uniref:Uncharacterized protein n=1 Tax=Dendryphion nanum TaxID=256645 RepID=A0A9P9EDZ8_9PLEO|nr:hypothetical protein B0J11DRAFT_502907 [Dendryphion nanum]